MSGTSRILKAGQVAPYSSEAEALFARMSTPPTTARKVIINALITSLISSGVWRNLDALYLTAAADSQAASLNWVANQYNLTEVNSPTFTADRGYTGNGTSSYLDTGFNATTAVAPKLTRNSAHASGWDRTSRAGMDRSLMGARQATTNYIDVVPRSNASNFIGRMNGDATAVSVANTLTTGLFTINRSASNALEGYRNASALGTSSQASAASPNANIFLLARSLTGGSPDSFLSDQIAMASIGASLTAAAELAKYNAVLAYLQAVGAA